MPWPNPGTTLRNQSVLWTMGKDMRDLLAGVRTVQALDTEAIDRIAARMLAGRQLSPGCDGRDIAFSIGLEACPHDGPTVVREGTIFYCDRLLARERDRRICEALAAHVLRVRAIDTRENVAALTLALTRKASGFARRIA